MAPPTPGRSASSGSSGSSGRSGREDPADRRGREAFIAVFVTANRFDGDIQRLCRAEGITHGQYSILWVLCLSDAPDGLPLGALADGLLHRSSDVSRLVDRLHALGLVARTPSAQDRRSVLVSPTERGREVFARLTAHIKDLHRHQWAPLEPGELDQLIHLLNKALWREEYGTFGHLPPSAPPDPPPDSQG